MNVLSKKMADIPATIAVHLDDELALSPPEVLTSLVLMSIFSKKIYSPSEFIINNPSVEHLYKESHRSREILEYLLANEIIVPIFPSHISGFYELLDSQIQKGTIRIPKNFDFAALLDKVPYNRINVNFDRFYQRFTDLTYLALEDERILDVFGILRNAPRVRDLIKREHEEHDMFFVQLFTKLLRYTNHKRQKGAWLF